MLERLHFSPTAMNDGVSVVAAWRWRHM